MLNVVFLKDPAKKGCGVREVFQKTYTLGIMHHAVSKNSPSFSPNGHNGHNGHTNGHKTVKKRSKNGQKTVKYGHKQSKTYEYSLFSAGNTNGHKRSQTVTNFLTAIFYGKPNGHNGHNGHKFFIIKVGGLYPFNKKKL